MHIDFALPPPDGDLMNAFENYKAKTAKAAMDFGLHMAVTKFDDKVHPHFSSNYTENPRRS